jgi:hypothetical protein
MHFYAILTNPALVGVLSIFASAIWMLRDPNDKTRPILVFALVFNLFYGFMLGQFMQREDSLFPWKFDHILFRIDQSLGLGSSRIALPLLEHARVPLWAVYQSMLPMMICWLLLTRYRNHRGSIIPAYAAELVVGPILYAIVPSCGPTYAFGPGWLNPPAVPANIIRLSGMPNAFPSLHCATAFVLVLFAPGKLWRAVALIFFAATCMATMSTGEHYVIDLVPGLAFGTFAASVGLTRYRRALGFLAIACAWSFAVRLLPAFLLRYPAVTGTAAVLTILLCASVLAKEWSAEWKADTQPASTPAIAHPAALLEH